MLFTLNQQHQHLFNFISVKGIGKRMKGDIVALGVFFLLLGLALLEVPLSTFSLIFPPGMRGDLENMHYSVDELDKMCKSMPGYVGRELFPEFRTRCNEVAWLKYIAYILIIVGGALVIYGFVSKRTTWEH
jgi:hypothetical protein